MRLRCWCASSDGLVKGDAQRRQVQVAVDPAELVGRLALPAAIQRSTIWPSCGGWGWDGAAIDPWLGELLASEQGKNKLSKLGRAHAAERHLEIVIDPFSSAGMGIPLGLTDHHERGSADYAIPSLVAPKPLTHLWYAMVAGHGWPVLGSSGSLPGQAGASGS